MVEGFLAKLTVSMSWDTCFHSRKPITGYVSFACLSVCLSLSSCLSDYLSVCLSVLIYLSRADRHTK